jgi:tetratricopeptide (TPR) repeat protein
MKGEWLRKSTARTTVVFVHGVLSSGESCWRNVNGAYWPELLKSDPELQAIGIYVFTYETGIFSGSYRLSDIVDALKEHMRLDEALASDSLIFVCHSMGGIVVRKYLVERATELIESEKQIGLFLVASPSLGARYADWLSPLAKLFGHAQADVLRFVSDNEWLQDLDKEFTNLKAAGRLTITGKELIEDKFVVLNRFWRRQVVEPFSGARYFGEPYKVPQSDHSSIAKPESNRAIQHRLLVQFIKDLPQPTPRPAPGKPVPGLEPDSKTGPVSAVGHLSVPGLDLISNPAAVGAQSALVQTPTGFQFVALGVQSPLQLMQTVQAKPTIQELFEIITNPDEVPKALFRTEGGESLVPYQVEYVKEREGMPDVQEALGTALRGSGGRLLVVGDGGLGKTREIAQLAQDLCGRGWTVCVALPDVDARMAPAAPIPRALLDSRMLFIVDDLQLRARPTDEQTEPYAERLGRFLKSIEEQFDLVDIRTILITREEPNFAQQPHHGTAGRFFADFQNFHLPEFTTAGLCAILRSLADCAGVRVPSNEIEHLVQESDRKPRTLFLNVQAAVRRDRSLTRQSWRETEGESWEEKREDARGRFGDAAEKVFDAVRQLTTAGVPSRPQYVAALAERSGTRNPRRVIEGLFQLGLLRMRKNILNLFSTEALGEGMEVHPDWDAIVRVLTETNETTPEWAEDLTNLSFALGGAEQFQQAEQVATFAIKQGANSGKIFFARAGAHFLTGSLSEAEDDSSAALARDKEDPNIHYFRGLVRYLRGSSDRALEDARRALELGRDDGSTHLLIARAHYQREDWPNADRAFSAAIERGERDGLTFFCRGIARLIQRDFAGAEADFSSSLEQGLKLAGTISGLEAMERGDMQQLVAASETAKRAPSDDAFVRGMRGMVRVMLGKFAEAEDDLSQALEGGFERSVSTLFDAMAKSSLPALAAAKDKAAKLQPQFLSNVVLLQLRGVARSWQNKFNDALADLQLALDGGAEFDALTYSSRGFAYLVKNRFEESAADFGRAIDLGRKDFFVYRLRGSAWLNLGKLAAADCDFTEAIQRGDKEGISFALRAAVRVDLGHPAEAEEDCDMALKLGAESSIACSVRGLARLALKKPAEAEMDFNRAIDSGREDAIVFKWRGLALLQQGGKAADAEKDFSKAIERGDATPHTLFCRGLMRAELSHYAKAEEDYTLALKSEPRNSSYLYFRGLARLNQDHPKRAEVDFTAAIEAGMKDADTFVQRARCRVAQEKWIEAERDLTDAQAMGDNGLTFHFVLGLARRGLKQYAAAERAFATAFAHDLQNPGYLAEHALTCLLRGNMVEAERTFDTLLAQQPEDVDTRVRRGWARYAQGKDAGAVDDYTAVLDATNDPAIRCARVSAHLRLGAIDKARADYDALAADAAKSGEAFAAEAAVRLAQGDFEQAAARAADAHRVANGTNWHFELGLALLLAGRVAEAIATYRSGADQLVPGDAVAALSELDFWLKRFAERAADPPIREAATIIRAELSEHIRRAVET